MPDTYDNPFGEQSLSNNVYVPQQGGFSTPDQASLQSNWQSTAMHYGQQALNYLTQIAGGAGKRKREKRS